MAKSAASPLGRLGTWVARSLLWILLGILWLWTIGACWFSGIVESPLAQILAVGLLVGLPLALVMGNRRVALFAFALLLIPLFLEWLFNEPKVLRAWEPDVATTISFRHEGERIHLAGVRNIAYRSSNDFDVRYERRTLDLRKLHAVDFMVERFHAFKGIAHTLLSFGFDDGQHLCISVEIRREQGEVYHPLAGMYKQYELIYVVGSEQDLIGLRTNHRRSDVWLFPIKTTPKLMRALLLDMLARAEKLGKTPEYYQTLTNNCTTNMVDHVLALAPDRIPSDWRILLPGFSAELAYEIGLVDTDLSLEEAMKHFRIDDIAQSLDQVDRGFSRHIRSRR